MIVTMGCDQVLKRLALQHCWLLKENKSNLLIILRDPLIPLIMANKKSFQQRDEEKFKRGLEKH